MSRSGWWAALVAGAVAGAALLGGAAPAQEPKKPDVRYVPTPPEVLTRMLEVGRVTKDDVVVDLGCGDGRIVLAAARLGATAVGYDIDPARIAECEASLAKESAEVRRRVRFERKDIFTVDVSGASVVMLYLRPELNVKLIPQLKKLKPGARMVSHSWNMLGRLTPDEGFPVKVKKADGYERDVYRWTAPLREAE